MNWTMLTPIPTTCAHVDVLVHRHAYVHMCLHTCLHVAVLPPELAPPPDQGVLIGTMVTLTCSATSQLSNLTITWSARDSEGMNLTLPVPVLMDKGSEASSAITLLDVDDGDTGFYSCSAFNRPDNVATAEFNFSVISELICVSLAVTISCVC